MMYLGDFRIAKTVRFGWNSNAVAGESITRATNGTISVYKDGGTTQSTTGVTDTEDFDTLTGVHLVAIDTSADGTFYSAGSDFMVVLSAATIDGKTINAVLAHFSLEARSALMPTTDGRKLDVSAGGEAGIDWANVGTPGSTVSLSATTVATTTTATNVTTVNGLAAGVITAASIAADAITDAKVAADVTIASVTGAVGSVTGNVGGNVTGSVGSIATGGIAAASFAAGAIDAAAIAANAIGASELAADAVAEIADAVWDEVLADHLTAGTTGNALNAAGSAGDPWATALPGAYGAGTAGRLIGRSLPDIVAGSAGGLLIAGSNAATTFATLTVSGAFLVSGGTTFTHSTGTGFTCSSSGGNGHGASFSGNGTGDGIEAISAGTGQGIHATGGGTSGSGAVFQGRAGNSSGVEVVGFGAGEGLLVNGGGTGDGLHISGGGTSGDAVKLDVTSGVGLRAASLTVTGATTLTGAVSLGSTLGVTGTTTLAALTTSGTVTFNSFVANFSAATKAELQQEATDALNAYDPPTNTEMVAAFTEIKGATWATTDTLEAIRDRGDAAWTTATGFSTLDAAGVRTAVGLASANLDTQLSAIDDFLDTEIAAIKAVTDQFTAAQAEPSAVPAANATPLQKIAWLALLARNKITQTATTQTAYADDGTTAVGTSTHSDDATTHTRGEFS